MSYKVQINFLQPKRGTLRYGLPACIGDYGSPAREIVSLIVSVCTISQILPPKASWAHVHGTVSGSRIAKHKMGILSLKCLSPSYLDSVVFWVSTVGHSVTRIIMNHHQPCKEWTCVSWRCQISWPYSDLIHLRNNKHSGGGGEQDDSEPRGSVSTPLGPEVSCSLWVYHTVPLLHSLLCLQTMRHRLPCCFGWASSGLLHVQNRRNEFIQKRVLHQTCSLCYLSSLSSELGLHSCLDLGKVKRHRQGERDQKMN